MSKELQNQILDFSDYTTIDRGKDSENGFAYKALAYDKQVKCSKAKQFN